MRTLATPRRRAAWKADPVFAPSREAPVFSRLDWDVRPTGEFGLLRIPQAPQTAPLDAHDAPLPDMPAGVAVSIETVQTRETNAPDLVRQALESHTPDLLSPDPRDPIQAHGDRADQPAVLQAEAQVREAQAYERGFNEGQAAGQQAAQEAATSEQVQILRQLLASLQAWRDAPEQVHAPLYRLALKLAQALVRCELSLSSQAIHQLVQGAIDALAPVGPGVLVTLNPDDWAVLQTAIPSPDLPWRVDTDPALSRGSVRVSADDAVVEDLMEDRLEALSSELFKPFQAT